MRSSYYFFFLATLIAGNAFAQSNSERQKYFDNWVPSLNEWDEGMTDKLCELVASKSEQGDQYLYSTVFIYIADKAGAIPVPANDEKYKTKLLDQNVVRMYLENNFTKMSCAVDQDKVHFLTLAFKTDNKDLLNDLLDLSKLYYNGRNYQYWHYDFTSTEANFGSEKRESFITFLNSQSDQAVKRDAWLKAVDRNKVSTLKYIFETNSKNVLKYLILNENYTINRAMNYGDDVKRTFYSFIEMQAESDKKGEWLTILKTDPAQLRMKAEQ